MNIDAIEAIPLFVSLTCFWLSVGIPIDSLIPSDAELEQLKIDFVERYEKEYGAKAGTADRMIGHKLREIKILKRYRLALIIASLLNMCLWLIFFSKV